MADIISYLKETLNNLYNGNKPDEIDYLGKKNNKYYFSNKDIIFNVYDETNVIEEYKDLFCKKLEKNMNRISLINDSIFTPIEIKNIKINEKNFIVQSFLHISNKDIINSLANEFKSDNINYIGLGAEAKIFLIDNTKIVKVYCRKISIKKDQNDLFKELQKQIFDLQGINGIVKPLEINKIKIKGFELLTQSFKYIGNKTLFDVITDKNTDYRSLLPIAIKIVLDLFYLHISGVAHYDIKPENIFINNKGNPKIGDFGFMERIGINKFITKGSYGYAAPEIFKQECLKVSGKADIYSLGVIFYYMFFGNKNTKNFKFFMDLNNKFDYKEYSMYLISELEMLIKDEKLRQHIKLFSEDRIKIKFLLLVKKMLDMDPNFRPDIEYVVAEMSTIFLSTRENYKKYIINGQEHNFQLKNKEQLILFFQNYINTVNIDFKIEEIKKMEKNIEKRILSFLKAEDISNEFKYNLSENLNKIFPNNDFANFDNEIISKMYPEEKEILNKFKKQMEIFKNIKIYYAANNSKYDTDELIRFCNTLNCSLNEFNIFENDPEQKLNA